VVGGHQVFGGKGYSAQGQEEEEQGVEDEEMDVEEEQGSVEGANKGQEALHQTPFSCGQLSPVPQHNPTTSQARFDPSAASFLAKGSTSFSQ
jgi:hypothetical protein